MADPVVLTDANEDVAIEGETMRESMESFLDADRVARLEYLRHDRIDLS